MEHHSTIEATLPSMTDYPRLTIGTEFGRIDQVSYPVEEAIDFSNSVEVSSDGGDE